jgi:predicted RNA-binding Zn-ribbon protein involved in translation (DUF1610 family)
MKIVCPNCGKMTIESHEIPNSVVVKRGFTGKKGPQFHRGRIIILTPICPECGHKYTEKKEINHAERIRRIQEAGLSTQITH